MSEMSSDGGGDMLQIYAPRIFKDSRVRVGNQRRFTPPVKINSRDTLRRHLMDFATDHSIRVHYIFDYDVISGESDSASLQRTRWELNIADVWTFNDEATRSLTRLHARVDNTPPSVSDSNSDESTNSDSLHESDAIIAVTVSPANDESRY